jgi:hypothetical protein
MPIAVRTLRVTVQEDFRFFKKPIEITSNGYNPSVVASGNSVFVVYGVGSTADPSPTDLLMLVKTFDGGSTFSTPTSLVNTTSSITNILAATQNNVYVTWNMFGQGGEGTFLSVSNDSGQSFGNPITVFNYGGGFAYPQIAATDDNVYVIIKSGITGENILFRASHNEVRVLIMKYN